MKKLCEWSRKDLEEHREELMALVARPTHVCRDCGRAAADKDALCKPVKLRAPKPA
ncbi:MAG: hypothetical protein Q8O14_13860 [bacterium]|nr:hypothetical protein [bacterium]